MTTLITGAERPSRRNPCTCVVIKETRDPGPDELLGTLKADQQLIIFSFWGHYFFLQNFQEYLFGDINSMQIVHLVNLLLTLKEKAQLFFSWLLRHVLYLSLANITKVCFVGFIMLSLRGECL